MGDVMWLYTGFLRVIIHVLGLAMLAFGTMAGVAATQTGPLVMLNPILGGVVGFLGAALAAGLLLGSLALLFEIRDLLREIRERLQPVESQTSIPRKEPTF